jgi:hypothetical protein
MRNFTVHLGSATRFLRGPAHARPRSPSRPLTSRPHLSATLPPGTVPRPTRQAPLFPLCPAGTRAVHVVRERQARAAAERRPPVGAKPTAPPRRVAPPRPGPPPFSFLFPLCRAAAEPLAPRSRCSTPLRLLLSSARASPPLPAPGPPPLATGSPLSLADARPWPSQRFSRPRVAGRRSPWYCAEDFKCFFNCFKS